MADEEPDVVDAVTDATNGIGSEALTAISNLGGGSGSIATGVVSRIGATITGRTGGFAPKAIITITKHGLAAIDRVEPIQGVDRGYRAVARDANGLESIHTVLDLDPREYDVTVTREGGVAIVEFVQQEPDPEPALPPGDDEAGDAGTHPGTQPDPAPEPMAPVKGAGPVDRRNEPTTTSPATTNTAANATRPLDTDGSGRVQHAGGPPLSQCGPGGEVERARAEAEKAKAQAEAERAQAEAEKAKAEAAAAKARAEAERVKAEADADAVRTERQAADQPAGSGNATRSPQTTSDEQGRQRTEAEQPRETGQFSASRELDTDGGSEPRAAEETPEPERSWGLADATAATDAGSSTGAAADSSDAGEFAESDDDGFGGFTPATPVEDEPPEYADGGTIETSISVHDESSAQGAVADGGTEDANGGAGDTSEDTGKFQF